MALEAEIAKYGRDEAAADWAWGGHRAPIGCGFRLWMPTVCMAECGRIDTESPMDPSESAQQSNLDLVARVGPLIRDGFAEAAPELFADDFVFHFFNSRLPELAGDHHGYDGLRRLFEDLGDASDTGFHNEPHSLTPYGDELVVAYATNTVGFGGALVDVDAVVVWRVVDGRILEAWDIPAVNTVRLHESDGS